MQTGLVFNIQKYSVQDGPGIRTTVFLKGCPLHCAWCHNPESISPRPEILVFENRCIGCAHCRLACKFADDPGSPTPLPPRNERCDLCGECVEACPTQARTMSGQPRTVPDLLEVVLKDRVFYQQSGGGVTFSGGEPLVQAPFLLAALEACKREHLHTCVDTCGMAPPDRLLEAAALTDIFLYDIKLMDESRHRQFTGVSNAPILENLRRLAGTRAQIWVRVPVVPGVNDTPAEQESIARFVASLSAVRQVNLLPFHRTGESKLRRLGRTDPAFGDFLKTPATPPEAFIGLYEKYGLLTKIGG